MNAIKSPEKTSPYDRLVVLNVGLHTAVPSSSAENLYDFCTAPLHTQLTPNYFERTLSTVAEVAQAQAGLPELTGLTPHSKLLIIGKSCQQPLLPITMETVAHIIAVSLGRRKTRFTDTTPLSIALFNCVQDNCESTGEIYQLATQLKS